MRLVEIILFSWLILVLHRVVLTGRQVVDGILCKEYHHIWRVSFLLSRNTLMRLRWSHQNDIAYWLSLFFESMIYLDFDAGSKLCWNSYNLHNYHVALLRN